jgi:excisionase family DNA binding protein
MVNAMEKLMTIDQAVAHLGVKRHRLTSPRARERVGITALKLGPTLVRFRRADLDAWLANHRSNPDDVCIDRT